MGYDADIFSVSKQQDSIFSGDHDRSVFGVQVESMMAADLSLNMDGFDEMTKEKYLFPANKLTLKEWFREL